MRFENDLARLRTAYQSEPSSEIRGLIEDTIIEKAEDFDKDLIAYNAVRAASSADGRGSADDKPAYFWKVATGRLSPLLELMPAWLETLENKKTRSDYRRGLELLAQTFVTTEEVTWDRARAFLKAVQDSEKVTSQTVHKWMSAYRNFWLFAGKKPDVWEKHRLARTPTIRKRPWTKEEVVLICDKLREEKDWLQHPVWIAAHTGARLNAVCHLTFIPERQIIIFPAQKRELADRTIPAHEAITESLTIWSAERRSASTTGTRFSELKTGLGFGHEVDFHSFRRTFSTELENLGCPESITADIVGHRKQTITYGLYSGGTRVEIMRDWINRLTY